MIYLDDEALEAGGSVNLGAALDAAARKLSPRRRIVVEVELDGRRLVGQELDAARSTPVEGREVRLLSADTGRLVADTLDGMLLRLSDARSSQAQAAALLQQDKIPDAMKHIAQVIEAWQQTQTAVLQSVQLLSAVPGGGLNLDQLDLQRLTDELIEQLKAMRSLLEAGDSVALADTLAYEWPATIDRWEKLIGDLIAAAGRGDE